MPARPPEKRGKPSGLSIGGGLIRELQIPELGKLTECAREFYASSRFLEEFDPARFRKIWTELMETGAGVIFSCEKEGCIAGAIGGIIHKDIYGHSLIAEEFFWFVQEEYRGDGLLLYLAFEKWAIARGAASIQMVHLLDLMPEKVAKFYRRQGYEPIETRYSKKLVAPKAAGKESAQDSQRTSVVSEHAQADTPLKIV